MLVEGLKLTMRYLPELIGSLMILKGVSVGVAVAQSAAAIAGMAAATPWMLGGGALIGAGVMWGAMQNIKGNIEQAQDGALVRVHDGEAILNPVQQTQLMASMDEKNTSAGNSSDTKSSPAEGQKRLENILAQGFKNMIAATLAPTPVEFDLMNGEMVGRTMDKIGGKLSPYG